ncbi:hypothetical protein hairong_090 [Pseudomonas phage hairong]|nr:hypothetical protein hairong_090 [Pseudomonas phage hairong]
MSLLCQLFGHKSVSGYAGMPPYVRIVGGGVDGIGTQHCRLMTKCRRCNETYQIASIHMPADFNARTRRTS